MMVTQQCATLMQLPSMQELGKFPLTGQTSCCAAFNELPNTFFFGSTGAQGFCIKVVTQNSEIMQDKAHDGIITAFAYASINSEGYLFSAAQDGKIKAWKTTEQGLIQSAEQTCKAEILCMQLTSATFIVAGLTNGCFAGWNLQTNQLDEFKAHEYPVTALRLH